MNKDNMKEVYEKMFPYGTSKPFLELLEAHDNAESPKSAVYVFGFSNNTVKIGVTQDIKRRKKTLCGMSGLKIKQEWNTDLLERGIAYKIETLSHNELKPQQIQGEFFSTPFDDACFTVALYTIIVSEGEAIKHEMKHKE